MGEVIKRVGARVQGRNAARFRRNWADVAWVRVPEVDWGLSSPQVLTMEYVPGVKISDVTALRAAGIDTSAVALRSTEAYLTQILRNGFFQA
jgi:predicted unusual protein kinase regulating ubiquinone biosynthesis (AarF/ABC1/UbiB family)